MSVFQLSVGAQCYDWGKLGLDSKVAQFAQCSPEFTVNEAKPYAELWMGTHPSLASKVFKTGETLKAHLASHPELLGDKVRAEFGDDLPFLFKVLAIRKALSIQAHPDKALAQKLHKERPDIYKGTRMTEPPFLIFYIPNWLTIRWRTRCCVDRW